MWFADAHGGNTWVCRSCETEEPRDSQAEAAMATQDRKRDDGVPAAPT